MRKVRLLAFALIALIFGIGATAKYIGQKPGFCGTSTLGSCETDQDCIRGGCSGEVCQSKAEEPRITACVWKGCYDPERYGIECKCITGKCRWG